MQILFYFLLFIHFRWSSALALVKQQRQMSNLSSSIFNLSTIGIGPNVTLNSAGVSSITISMGNYDSAAVAEDLNIILNIYSQKLTKDRNGMFIKAMKI